MKGEEARLVWGRASPLRAEYFVHSSDLFSNPPALQTKQGKQKQDKQN